MIIGETTIYKYRLGLSGSYSAIEVEMPVGARILSVQIQRENINLERVKNWITAWALIDKEAKIETRQFWILGTGQGCPKGIALKHLATVQDSYGYVWHVFDEVNTGHHA